MNFYDVLHALVDAVYHTTSQDTRDAAHQALTDHENGRTSPETEPESDDDAHGESGTTGKDAD